MSNDILNVPKAPIAFTAVEARLPTNSRLTRYSLYTQADNAYESIVLLHLYAHNVMYVLDVHSYLRVLKF